MTTTVDASNSKPNGGVSAGFEMVPTAHAGSHLEVVESSRATAEVQGMIIAAKRFPRDQNAAYSRIMTACQRQTLAGQALFAYPRGKETITGPTIRLAEMLAQSWGNVSSGIRELEQRKGLGRNEPGESSVEAFSWDLETNFRLVKVFQVPHVRHTRSGSTVLTDPRDIYELVANQGARRLRACILGVIPGDIVEAAVARCRETMERGGGEPLPDRIRKCVAAFAQFSVTPQMLAARLGHPLEETTAAELVELLAIFNALKEDVRKRAEFFEVGAQKSDVADRFGAPASKVIVVDETGEGAGAA